MIAFKELVRNEAGDQWGLGKPEYVCSYDFWALYNTNDLGCNGEDTTAKDMCIDIDISIYFILEKLMRKKHKNVLGEHIYYVRNYIQKPFKMGTLEYTEHVCEMFKMDKILPLPIINNEDYHEAAWDNKDKPYKEEIMCKAITDFPIVSIKEEVKKKFDRNYRTIPTKEYIGLLGTLEAMDERRRAYLWYHTPIVKKKTDDHPDGDDANSDVIPRVPLHETQD